MLAMVLNQVGLPLEGIALIMGVDRLLDMIRTAVNITDDSRNYHRCKSEGSLDESLQWPGSWWEEEEVKLARQQA